MPKTFELILLFSTSSDLYNILVKGGLEMFSLGAPNILHFWRFCISPPVLFPDPTLMAMYYIDAKLSTSKVEEKQHLIWCLQWQSERENYEKSNRPNLTLHLAVMTICINVIGSLLTGGNWQKWKRVFLTCPCHEIYRDEAVGLNSCKNTWKITIFVKMWNLGQYRENLIFCQ